SQLYLFAARPPCLRRQHRHPFPRPFDDILLNPNRYLKVGKLFLPRQFALPCPERTIDGLSSAMSGCHGVDDIPRARDQITAGENPFEGGLLRIGVDRDPSCRGEVLSGAIHKPKISHLTDGGDNGVRLEGETRSLLRYGLSPAAAVKFAEGHILTLNLRYPTVLADDPCGGDQKPDVHTLSKGLFDLFLVGRHIFLFTPI